MKILIVGGTGFLGSAITVAALAAGHKVTVLTRGRSGERKIGGANHIFAERHGPLTELEGQSFDIVADTCCFGPETVRHLLQKLKGNLGCYALVSSISAYADLSQPLMKEDSPAARAPTEVLERLKGLSPEDKGDRTHYDEHYGALKAESENVALEMLPTKSMVLRAGLLVGVGDPYDRFGYWVRRVDQGSDMAVPGSPDRPVQIVDVRDIADFILLGNTGMFNVTGIATPFIDILRTIKEVSQSSATFKWVSDEIIAEHGVKGWTDLPLWLPESEVAFRHILNVDVSKAFAHGMKTRLIAETVQSILNWDRSRRDVPLKAGISPQTEMKLLA